MTAEKELLDRDPLRDTPEGELWTSVLVDAVEGLGYAVGWLDRTYQGRRDRLEKGRESGEIRPVRYRERLRDLERERREREEQVRSCAWFFFHPDSPIDFICEVLNYPVDQIREHARKTGGPRLEAALRRSDRAA